VVEALCEGDGLEWNGERREGTLRRGDCSQLRSRSAADSLGRDASIHEGRVVATQLLSTGSPWMNPEAMVVEGVGSGSWGFWMLLEGESERLPYKLPVLGHGYPSSYEAVCGPTSASLWRDAAPRPLYGGRIGLRVKCERGFLARSSVHSVFCKPGCQIFHESVLQS